MSSSRVRLALIQMQCADDRQRNLEHATHLLKQAAEQGAQLACLPELFLGHYPCQSEGAEKFAQSEQVPGPTTAHLERLAGELQMAIVGSLFERRTAGVYHNTSVVIDADGKYVGKYRKMHIPDDPLYYEKFYFTPGDLGYQCFETRFARIGPLICWDQWFPEAARLTALLDAQLLVYPTAIGWHPSERTTDGDAQLDAWQTIQRAHAIANGCFVAAINRVGHEGPQQGGLEFWGHSFICHPSGQVLAKGPADEEAIVTADIELADIETQRTNWPFFRDRRIDSYADLLQRFGV